MDILMFSIIGGLALGLIAFKLAVAWLRPVSKKKAVRFKLKDQRRADEDWNPDTVFQLLKLDLKNLYLSKEFEDKMNADLRRIGSTKTAETIRKEQILLFCSFTGIGLFSYWVLHPGLGLLAFCIAVAGWVYPKQSVQAEIRKVTKHIEMKFPAFYRRNYYAYKSNVNTALSRVIESHMRVCDPDFRRELKTVLEDIESLGEFEAIQRWKRRLPLPYVIRYAEIMESRLKGENNTAVMENFKYELDKLRETQIDKELLRAEGRIDKVLGLTYVPFLLLLVVYFLAQMQASGLVEMINTFRAD
ncbi:hypothetical protein [Paenibacillus turpanensis]|uniref:hypothetical protein n=1 Tax=Paenibacillus turpanensis TaxID=2689078 RepID=UPI00140CEF9F|nr:hypothetical protein [Paenibacillus turpanensis]